MGTGSELSVLEVGRAVQDRLDRHACRRPALRNGDRGGLGAMLLNRVTPPGSRTVHERDEAVQHCTRGTVGTGPRKAMGRCSLWQPLTCWSISLSDEPADNA